MNKGILYFFVSIAVILIGYNATMVDYNQPFEGDSFVALASIIAAASAILLLLILNTSKKIEKKASNRD